MENIHLSNENTNGNAKKNRVPHTYVIIFSFVILMALMTYIIPAGEYARFEDPVTGRTIVDATSYHEVEQNGVSIFSVLKSVTLGMQSAADVVFFVFIIGGAMQIIYATGAIDKGIGNLARKVRGREHLVIPIFALIFALGGATFGVSDEIVIFAPLGVALAQALGYDALTGLAMIALGAAAGFNAGFMNPFTIGVAQSFAELPIYSGIKFRIIVFLVLLPITILYIMRYAKKVKGNPQLSYVKDCLCEKEKIKIDFDNLPKINIQDTAVLLTVLIGIGYMIYGVLVCGWYIDEMAAIFLAIGIISGFIGKMGPSRIANEFVEGAKSIAFGALISGVARGILVVMQDGMIVDSVIHGLSLLVTQLPKSISVLGMYVFQIIVNFFIPSSTGQAATVMPIMIPLADVVGITRQTAVLSFQFGDGFSNSIIPTSGVLMSYLAAARIPYEKWVKFVWPIMLIWIGTGAVFLVIANGINYGPF